MQQEQPQQAASVAAYGSATTSTNEHKQTASPTEKAPQRSPLETTFFLFKITFEWITSLVLRGWWRVRF